MRSTLNKAEYADNVYLISVTTIVAKGFNPLRIRCSRRICVCPLYSTSLLVQFLVTEVYYWSYLSLKTSSYNRYY